MDQMRPDPDALLDRINAEEAKKMLRFSCSPPSRVCAEGNSAPFAGPTLTFSLGL